ncbi:MAG: class 1 fructose-bisphosphatase [Actinobacteria bacterium]|nr:class 1 fructose-bisphosphatase [Actinomycetota bacterium]
MRRDLVTIERFLLDQQPAQATGDLTALLYDIALAGKLIASRTRRAGLTDILGRAGTTNVQGEDQKVLDVYADEVMHELLGRGGRVSALVSEEQEERTTIPDGGPYVVAYDPLDGSSNIASDVSIGTIFGVFRSEEDRRGTVQDCLRPGRDLVAAGYILYSTATLLVYSAGDGVHVFTLDPGVGEFLLTDPDVRYPDEPAYYSINYAAAGRWNRDVERYVAWLDSDDPPVLSQRYIGSAVADFHRNLIHGGVFGYPADDEQPEGKLRLLYEAAPLAYLADQAGGYATDGLTALLDITPTELHQRTPVYVGDQGLARQAETLMGPRV